MSDIALGAILVAVAALTIANVPGNPLRNWPRLDAWFLPAVVAALLVVVGLVLILRGSFLGHRQPERWSLGALVTISVLVILVLAVQAAVIGGLANSIASVALPLGLELFTTLLVAHQRIGQSALLFGRLGPPELATLIVLTLTAAIALARPSRVRAAGMVLLGLLLSTVGTDVATGTLRLTMGLEGLIDGVPFLPVALGLIVVADSAICLASPTLLLWTYTRRVAALDGYRIDAFAGVVLRILAALAVAAASALAFTLNATTFDIAVLAAFGALGAACKLLGWNRPVLLLAMAYGAEFAEHFRRSILLSNGDPAVFMRWPLSATFLVLTCGVVVIIVLLSLRRTPAADPQHGIEPAPG